MRRSNPTRPDHRRARRSRALSEFANERQISREHERLLAAVVEGRRGRALYAMVGVSSLEAAERDFEYRTGTDLYQAAIEVLRRAARKSPRMSAQTVRL